ncbi:hypothetical protein PQC39_gp089 [Vibrio phage Vp_R1]|uniref:Uncharacterized protein n=1 Tax=Vibrio phage Vp_R1 TaxID=2059867 RepID=A0A2H5BQ41_9CAUD|nr:hypothetical protein PQC39_gp089 [Vibrio phage Vp_R1]AUG88453.1 hypothetical protein VPR_089 [Vibrio phage Vp_R1]
MKAQKKTIWQRLFGGNDVVEVIEPVEKQEPVVIEQVKPEPKPEPIPQKSEEEKKLDDFENQLKNKGKAISAARDTLYDKKAQLNVMRNNQEKLQGEINGLEIELAGIESDWSKATASERTDLEIRGQKVQQLLASKKHNLAAQKTSLLTFEKTIDVLEKNIANKENELATEHTRLESAKTAVAVIALNDEIDSTLSLNHMSVDESGLDVFIERQKVVLEDVSTKVSSVSPIGDHMALPFKQRMSKEEEEVEDAEVTPIVE